MTWHLHDGRESCDVDLKGHLFRETQLSEQFLYWNKVLLLRFWVLREINSRFCSKTRWQMFLLVYGRHVGAHLGGHQHGVSIQISINLGETFLRISSIRKFALTWILTKVFAYLPSFYFQNLDLIYWTVLIFYFDLFWMDWHWKAAIHSEIHFHDWCCSRDRVWEACWFDKWFCYSRSKKPVIWQVCFLPRLPVSSACKVTACGNTFSKFLLPIV